MFFDVRDVPKPKTTEEMVRNYRASTNWNGTDWVEGGRGGTARREASRAAAAARSGAPAAESDEEFDPGL